MGRCPIVVLLALALLTSGPAGALTQSDFPADLPPPAQPPASTPTVPLPDGSLVPPRGVTPHPLGRITVALNASPTHAAAPLVANLSVTVSSANATNFTIIWDFDDGSANLTFQLGATNHSAAMRTNHTFSQPGQYVVNVSATDNENNTRGFGTLLIGVAPAFQVVLALDPSHALVGRPIVITPNATGGVPPYRAAWTSVPAGCYAGSFNLTCVPASPGNFSVRVTVSDATVDRFSEDVLVVAVFPLLVTASYVSAFSCNASSGVAGFDFTATSSGGASPVNFTWTIGNGSAPAYGAVVSTTFPLNQTFLIIVVAADAIGDRASSSVTVTTSYPTCGAVPPPNYAPPRQLLLVGAVVGGALVVVFAELLWHRRRRGRRPGALSGSEPVPADWSETSISPSSSADEGPPTGSPPPWKE